MKKYIFFILILFGCKQNANQFETKDWFEANIILSSKKIFENEIFKIIINENVIYQVNGDTTKMRIYKYFKFPEKIRNIKVESFCNGNKIISKSFSTTYLSKRYEIIINSPYPKDSIKQPFPLNADWFKLPIETIKRDVIIRADTSRNNIII